MAPFAIAHVRTLALSFTLFFIWLTSAFFGHDVEYNPQAVPGAPGQGLRFSDDYPKRFWQLKLGNNWPEGSWAEQTASWDTLNPSWDHVTLTDDDIDAYVLQKYAHRPHIVAFWNELEQPVLKADLWRYLALLADGGVYSDLDTTAFVPIDEWIPAHLQQHRRHINVVAGLEYADHTYRIFPRNISFCQWTLMSKAGHPVFDTAVSKLISRLEYHARVQKTAIGKATLTREEVLASTGPGLYSDALLEVIRDQLNDYTIDWTAFEGLQEPKLFGDILVMPINAFGMGQKHSHSGDAAWGTPLMRHHFGSSWFKKKKAQQQSDS